MWFCWLKIVGWNTCLYPQYCGRGTQLCAVSKFGNCTHNCITHFKSTVGNTDTVAKPSFLPHHNYIRTGHTYLIQLSTINMTLTKPPVQNPVDIPFENGIILTTTINPITCRHSIQCDLCGVIIDLGITASGSPIRKHRDHEPCRKTAHKLRTQRARERIQVCMPRS